MKKIGAIVLVALMTGACSRVNTSTSNNIPTTDAYEAAMRTNGSGAGGATGAVTVGKEPVMNTGATSAMAGTMTFDNRPMTEESFLMEAASSNIMEIEASRLALQKATHAEVKKFAQMLVDHHTKTSLELMSVASGMNVNLPTTMMPAHQEVMTKLSKLSGADFDEEYMQAMVSVHKQDVAKFEVVSNSAPTVSVKAFAIRALPALRIHLREADQLEDKVDK
ncbi:DUF4142 domain-containing protein [Rufibacter sp. LB8]|uniref:DUF4142 domain-containing protein n=1 Tax=Rufibacter sp. LB8 TaxID=2777781 RepID=UPI00178C7689|nr:DUF4142 domain-containing protein [Rufibacter sp. LB8]